MPSKRQISSILVFFFRNFFKTNFFRVSGFDIKEVQIKEARLDFQFHFHSYLNKEDPKEMNTIMNIHIYKSQNWNIALL